MGEWKLAADGCAAQCGYHVIVSAEEERALRVSLMCSCSYAVARDIPFPILASVMASTDQGREAMARSLGSTLDAPLMATLLRGLGWVCFPSQDVVAALRAAGWTCCEPGTEERWVIEGAQRQTQTPVTFCAPTRESAEKIIRDAGTDDATAVRYIRCDAPGTAEGGE